MPDTAELMGLALSPRDERLDPEKNGRSSAQYLKYLFEKFHDWRLALAAYNAGEGTVHRLLEKHKTRSYDAIAQDIACRNSDAAPKWRPPSSVAKESRWRT